MRYPGECRMGGFPEVAGYLGYFEKAGGSFVDFIPI